MKRARLLLVVLLAACGSGAPEPAVCTAGTVLGCLCTGGARGTATCNDAGTAFAACACGGSMSGAGGGTGASSGTGGGSACPANVGVGATCSTEGQTCAMSAACCDARATCHGGTWVFEGTACGTDCGLACGDSGLTCMAGALCIIDHTDGLGPESARCHPNTCPDESVPQEDCCEPICNEDSLNMSGAVTGVCYCNCGTC